MCDGSDTECENVVCGRGWAPPIPPEIEECLGKAEKKGGFAFRGKHLFGTWPHVQRFGFRPSAARAATSQTGVDLAGPLVVNAEGQAGEEPIHLGGGAGGGAPSGGRGGFGDRGCPLCGRGRSGVGSALASAWTVRAEQVHAAPSSSDPGRADG